MTTLLLLLACSAPAPTVQARGSARALHVESTAPFEEVRLLASDGSLRLRRRLPAPTRLLELPVELPAGEWSVEVDGIEVPFQVAPATPLSLQVQTQPGSPWEDAPPRMTVPVLRGATTEVVLGLLSGPGAPSSVELQPLGTIPLVNGRELKTVRVGEEPIPLLLDPAGPLERSLRLEPRLLELAELQQKISLDDSFFPADAEGAGDPARPAFQVNLGSALWEPLRARLRTGRRSDVEAAWAYWAFSLSNRGDLPMDLVITLDFQDEAFRSRSRDGGTPKVSSLMRVPAGGSSRAAVPVYVDQARVISGRYPVALTVGLPGSDQVLLHRELELFVSRSDGWSGGGFLAMVVAAGAGSLWALWRLRRWLQEIPTAELMMISMVGSALFVVGGVADLITVSLSALLGPFSVFLSGLPSEAARVLLLGSLLSLRPHPGTLSLALLVGWLMRGLALGAFSPTDPLFLGSSILFGELCAWAAGLSRGQSWAGRPESWFRLSVAFCLPSLASALGGLTVHAVLYRLYYAPWYLVLVGIFPGVLYPFLSSFLAARLVRRLQQVAP
ncbi:MAG TPA: hypothetical protein PLA94_05705 [Myxococcota bacterium]|nr:hypothetical protein [Myxococcota bacterium]